MISHQVSRVRLSINVLANVLGVVAGALVSLLLTPYIIRSLGPAAYSLVPLATQITLYFSLATVAVNSMSARFVTHELHGGRTDEARVYLSTTMVSNLGLLVLLAPVAALVVWRADSFLDVPDSVRSDFRLLLIYSFLGFALSLVSSVFAIRLFVGDAFAAQSAIGLVGALGRALSILILFSMFPPSISFVGLASVVSAGLIAGLQFGVGRRVVPALRASLALFRWSAAATLIRAGFWALVSQASQLLLSGVSLLIANVFIGARAAAPYAIALIVPNLVSGVIAALSSVFVPTLIGAHARGEGAMLLYSLRRGNRVVGSVVCLICGDLVVFGKDFYRLWLPTQDSRELWFLTLIILTPMAVFAANGCLFSMYTVLNRLRSISVVTLIAGIVSVCLTVILLQLHLIDPPVFAIPLSSGAIMVLVNGVFLPWSVGRLLGVRGRVFISESITFVVWLILLGLCGGLTRYWFGSSNWGELVGAVSVYSALGGALLCVRVIGTRRVAARFRDQFSSAVHALARRD